MAIHRVKQVFVVNGRFQGDRTIGNLQGTFPFTGNQTVDPITNALTNTLIANPAPGANDVAVGNLVAINAAYKTAYQNVNPGGTIAQLLQYQNQRGNLSSILQFAVNDPVRGVRLSDNISYDNVHRVNVTPFQQQRPQVTCFFTGYGTAANPTTYVGQDLTVGVKVGRDYPEYHKNDFFASVRIPGAVSPNLPPQPATVNQIRLAHFQLLEQLLTADPDGLFFDAAQSRLMSYNANYLVIYLVGAFKRVFAFDAYANMMPIKHDVYFVQGFQNPVYEGVTTAAGVNNAMAGSNSYMGVYVTPDQGSGNGWQVRWHEAEALGFEGHTNNVQWNTPRRLFGNDAIQYDCVDIDYVEPIVIVGENQRKEAPKHLTIYFNRQSATPAPAWNLQGVVGGAAGAISGVPLLPIPAAGLTNANFSLNGSTVGGANYAGISALPANPAWNTLGTIPVLNPTANPGVFPVPANTNSLIQTAYNAAAINPPAQGALASEFANIPLDVNSFIGRAFSILNT